MPENLYLRAPGEKRRVPGALAALIHLDEPGVSGFPLHHNLSELWPLPAGAAQPVSAFLLAALGVWAADKFVARRSAPDAWGRDLVLHLPLDAPWGRLSPRLAALLTFLTGDAWTLKGRQAALDPGFQARWPHTWQPDGVVLFSGGLDSLAGAIDQLEAGRRLVLASHYDFGQLAACQQALAAALASYYGPERVHHLALRVQFPEARESTLRSRSLLYLALGLAAAAAFEGETPVVVPENGWISLNPPLSLNRLGALTTRTTHPCFLGGLAKLWREAGIGNPLVNPYRQLTKGQVLAGCRNRALLEELFPLAVSCSRPVAARWQGGAGGSCGYCYPCLVRRAAAHSLGWDRGRDYLWDVFASPETLGHRVRGRDLRALLLGLRTWEDSPESLEDRLCLGEEGLEAAANHLLARPLLSQGFGELARFFRDRAPQWLLSYLS